MSANWKVILIPGVINSESIPYFITSIETAYLLPYQHKVYTLPDVQDVGEGGHTIKVDVSKS